jgi:hypothetical protein
MMPDIFIDLAKGMGRAHMDYIIIEDSSNVSYTYKGTHDTYPQYAQGTPKLDPAVLVPWLAQATQHLGLVPTFSVQAIMSMHECAGKNMHQQKHQRLITDEIVDGRDELGVLLLGHAKGAYWYGSQLDIHEARKLTPYNNATSIQVCAPVLSGIIQRLDAAQGPFQPVP